MHTVRWGILGTGRIASSFASALEAVPGAELAAVGSRSRDTARRFVERSGSASAMVHGSYDALAADDSIDLVYVATPHRFHRDNALTCIDAGRGVVIEKPFTMNVRETDEVIGRARERGVFCMEAMWMRFAPVVELARQTIADGSIGRVRAIDADLGFPGHYDPDDRVFDPEVGGGATLDLGVYPLSFAMAMLGMPTDVAAVGTTLPNGADEQMAARLRFAGGEIATIRCSILSQFRNRATIFGDRGTLELDPLYFPTRLRTTIFRSTDPMQPPAARSNRGSGVEDATGDRRALAGRAKAFAAGIGPVAEAYRRIRELRAGSTTTIHPSANGYEYEAAEAGRALLAGQLETPVLPLDETRRVMEVLDEIRAQIGVSYDADHA